MANDQQFCLRWNNHQSTLISVFDSLLENGTLVDCTLAAEGQYLKAHKVVLSACSPYLETLLSQHYEKHPIVILKDVKFSELKSMMDYMYRGEVNISQDQLGTFLKAAESLQIKGLSDNGDEAVGTSSAAPKKDAPRPSVTQTARPIESKRPAPPGDTSDASRDGSISPSSLRKRRRTRRPSQGEENHLDSNVCDTAQSTPIVPAVTVPAPVKQIVKQEPNLSINETGLKKEIIDPPTEPLLEPKTEYLDYMNNENSIEVEDLTLDDDDDLDSSMDNSRPGPSHGDMSNQGYPAWPMGDQSGTDEIFMAAQEAVGAATGQQQRDSQGGDFKEPKEEIKEEPSPNEIKLEAEVKEEEFIDTKAIVEISDENVESEETSIDPFAEGSQSVVENQDLVERIPHQAIILNNAYTENEMIVPEVLDEGSSKKVADNNLGVRQALNQKPLTRSSSAQNTTTGATMTSLNSVSNKLAVNKTIASKSTETRPTKKTYDVTEFYDCKKRSFEVKQYSNNKKTPVKMPNYRRILPAEPIGEKSSPDVSQSSVSSATTQATRVTPSNVKEVDKMSSTILSVPCNPPPIKKAPSLGLMLQSSSVSSVNLPTQPHFAIATSQISQQITTSGSHIMNQFQISTPNMIQSPESSLGTQIINQFQIPSQNVIQSPQTNALGNQITNQFQISSQNIIQAQDSSFFVDQRVLESLGGMFLRPNSSQFTSIQSNSSGSSQTNPLVMESRTSTTSQASVPKAVKFSPSSHLRKISPQEYKSISRDVNRGRGGVVSSPSWRPTKHVKILPKPGTQ